MNNRSTVRTRFAPSPTGYLHLGSLRTALFNYLFARHHKGRFILRVEDTDQSRYVEGAIDNLIDVLQWAGITYDEGPLVGGDHGPYVQSERLDIYRRYVMEMVASGHAYYCFCTPTELEAMRDRQQQQGLPTRYDGTWRDRDADEVQRLLDSGVPHVIRLKMPLDGETVFEDLVRGEVRVQNEMTDDQVLLKSDGFPTYHLAVVVDDHLMGISHIIRGEEWLLSVPKHLQIYKAMGWPPPQMAHLSLLLNADRSKLSKRQGDVAVEDYRDKGYLPEALVNYVSLLGWSPADEQEFFTMAELIEQFSIERVSKSGAVFDVAKLNWMNGNYIRELPAERLNSFLTPFLKKAGADTGDASRLEKILLAVQKKIERGDQVFEAAQVFFRDVIEVTEAEALEYLQAPTTRTVLQGFLDGAAAVETLDMGAFKQIMSAVQKESGIKGPALWKPIRVALTGTLSGPELPAVIDVFGKARAMAMVRQVLDSYVP